MQAALCLVRSQRLVHLAERAKHPKSKFLKCCCSVVKMIRRMNDAVADFPFVAELPKREKSRLARLWDHLREVRAVQAEKGEVIPQSFVGDLLGLSTQRVGQFLDEGRLEGVSINGRRYVTVRSIEQFAQVERKTGRPFKVACSNKDVWKASLDSAKGIVGSFSK